MESRRLITAILLTFVLWMVLQKVMVRYFPQPPAQTATAPATQTAETLPTTSTSVPTTHLANVRENKTRDDNIAIGNSKKGNGYPMEVVFSNHGAAINTVQLSGFAESVKDSQHGYRLISPVKYDFGTKFSLATEKLLLTGPNGDKIPVDLENVNWFHKVEKLADRQQVKFWIDVIQNDKPVVRVVKTYALLKTEPSKPDYDLHMDVTLENLTDQTFTAVIRQEGLVGIRKEDPRYEDRKILAGIIPAGSKGITVTSSDRAKLIKAPDHSHNIAAVDDQPVWSGQTNKYFAAILTAVDKDDKVSGKHIESILAKTYSDNPEFGEDLTTLWTTRPIKIDPKRTAAINFDLYLGPRSETIFTQDKYAERNFTRIQTIETSWCTMQWLADFMTWLLNHLYLITRNYGLAIILLVVIVRVVLHPVTKSSQVSMMRMQRDMQRLQPKMNALKEKYKNNREALNKAMMDLYKEEGVNPAAQMMGCLPMMLQMPIWVALWTALNNAFALRHQPFFLWIRDLAGPDALVHISDSGFHIPLISSMVGPIHDLNVLPILLFISMILQQMFTPQAAPSPDADPAQVKQQRFIMWFMSIFMGLIFYNAPSGLNLYILTSNFLGVLESKRIRKHLEEEQKVCPVQKKKSPPGWWEKLRKKAEQYAAEYEKTKKK